MSKNKPLFQEFPTITLQEWEEKIIKDLKGKPLSALENNTQEGISYFPHFTKENSSDYYLENSDSKRKPSSEENNWNTDVAIKVKDSKIANTFALNSLKNGVNSLTFKGDLSEISVLLDNIMIEIVSINFITRDPKNTISQLKEICNNRDLNLNVLKGSITYDFLTDFAKNKKPSSFNSIGFENLNSLVNEIKESKFEAIAIGTCMYQKAGANITQQIAIGLSKGVEYLNNLTENNSIDDLANKVTFHFNIGNDYFMEIAKIRAFRLLWSQVLTSFGAKNTKTTISATTSSLLWAEKDMKNNMLRATSQAMSAVIGGCDSLNILPFDTINETTKSYSKRVASNVHHILKEESYLDKVNDPSNGSYFIEHLSNTLAENSWELFQSMEEKGGFIKCIENKFIETEINKSAEKLKQDYKEGKITVVGVNKYAQEKSESELNIPKFN